MTRAAQAKRPVSPGCPEAVAGLDLSRHGLLEASAGTGKTYAIEHMVLRMLLEQDDIELPRILVVTFTEKAAGELKEKIRARLAARMAQGGLAPAELERLKDAHLSFDRASIFTIHGFCQRVLSNYAFENNALFRLEVVKEDRQVLEEALHEEMRSTWIREAGEGAGADAFRRLAGSLNLGAKTRWQDRLIPIAKAYNPARGDALLPELDPARVDAAQAEMLAAVGEVRALFPDAAEREAFLARYRAIKWENPNHRKKAPQAMEMALALAAGLAGRSREEGLAACEHFLANLPLRSLKEGFDPLLPGPEDGGAGTWPALDALIQQLNRIRRALGALKEARKAEPFESQRRAILGLRERAQALKRERGLIGFDDMIERVHAALRDRPALVRALRQEYRCCLVDEFQDTDPLQWSIFKRLFLDAGGTHPLFLIGDPKQAIYRFRGGDIHTYMDARRELQALSRQGLAQGLSLGTNFRSSLGMVEACNAAFTHPEWFHAMQVDPGAEAWRLPGTPDPLGYLPAGHGGLPIQACRDSTPAPQPLILRDFASGSDKAAVAAGASAWMVAEIAALMADPGRLLIPDRLTGGLRPIGFGDICILVKAHKEKPRLERALLRAGIPYQVDKRKGLYDTDAAANYLAVLEALEDPRDAGKRALALLTRFFRPAGDPPPAGPPAEGHPWLDHWARLAAHREWQRLFHDLLYGTGLLHRESLEEDGDRRIMDFVHIAQNLVLEALSQGHSLPGLAQRLRDLCEESDRDEEEGLHREESEGGKVVLMTMHASKGLEFPVVFLAAFSGGRTPPWLKYREGGRTVFNLDGKDEAARALYAAEAEGEERRLFYVAFTRARYKLYVPLLPAAYPKSSSGPLGGFVAQALRTAAAARPDLFHVIRQETPAGGRPGEAAPSNSQATSRAARTAEPPPGFLADAPAGAPFGGLDAAFSARRRRLNSYSHLVRRGGEGVAAEDLEGRFDKDEAREAAVPEDQDFPDRSAPGNALPRGKETGNMFHEILEDLDFALAASAAGPDDLLAHRASADIIAARMAEHRLAETHRGDVAAVVWNTLNARLPDVGAPGERFRLGEVDQRRHEMEFLFPYPDRGSSAGYLWGFIDLVFRRGERYYLLDWKSNWLDAYGPEAVERSIRESRYDLQYMLYAVALDRWLRSVRPGYDFRRHFGGVYYVYLRGMDAGAAPGQAPGLFGLKPTAEQVESGFPAHLDQALGRAAGPRAADLLAREGGPA